MFSNIVTNKPLLLILLTMAPGIFVGSYCYGVYSLAYSVVVAVVLSLLSLRFTITLPFASFFFGIALATSSIQRGYEPIVSLPFMNEVEEYMNAQRERMLSVYRDADMPDDVYGIVSAMTLGERHAVSRPLRESYNVSGVSHVFALSGLHLSIIFMFLSLLLPTRLFPRFSSLMQLLLLWTFVFLVGIHPSLLRAAVMFTCYILCRLLSRNTHSIDILIFAAFLLLVYNPQWLFDIGFQMSFMAMVGILLLATRLMRLVPMPQWARRSSLGYSLWYAFSALWGMLVVSLSASIAVMPLIALYFGRVSFYGLLANLVVSPCATLILFLSILLQVVAFLSAQFGVLPSLPLWIGQGINHVVTFMNHSVQWVAHLPGSSLEGVNLSVAQTVLLYVIIVTSLLLLRILRRGIRPSMKGK